MRGIAEAVKCNSTRQDPAVDFAPGAPKLDEKAADALQLIRSKLDRIVYTLSEPRCASTYTVVCRKASEADEANNFNESVTYSMVVVLGTVFILSYLTPG